MKPWKPWAEFQIDKTVLFHASYFQPDKLSLAAEIIIQDVGESMHADLEVQNFGQ